MTRADRYDLAPRITGALDDRDAELRTRVIRALLVRPILRAQPDGELFRTARRHADGLQEWFARETGWRLLVETQSIRLITSHVPVGRTGIAIAERHPARARKSDPPFTRRRYVLLCLSLAVLESADLQISLGRLAEQVVLLARSPGLDDIEFTLTGRDQRSDLVAAIRLLLGYGVLVRVAGDEESYVSTGGDALYDVDRRVLAAMLSVQHAPSLVAASLGDRPPIADIEAALHRPPPAYTENETTRQVRHAVTRRLLCDPVVYYDELPEPERAYLTGQRVPLTRRLAEATGLIAELRAEGVALVDPDDQLTDLRMPEQGTGGHSTLLIAEHLAADGPTDIASLRQVAKRNAREHQQYWSKTSREPGAENDLVDLAVDRLIGLGLVRVDGTGRHAVVQLLPALQRFVVTAPAIRKATR